MIAIIKYNAGNLGSIKHAVSRLGFESTISNDLDTIKSAEKVIFPGVGRASSAIPYLASNQLDKLILGLTQPVLGICLGLQLMCRASDEGEVKCLGIFDVHVKKFTSQHIVPHVGWNDFQDIQGSLFNHISPTDNVYYSHSYYAALGVDTVATCMHTVPFACAMQKNNFYAVQFHPEKSGKIGEKILANFLNL